MTLKPEVEIFKGIVIQLNETHLNKKYFTVLNRSSFDFTETYKNLISIINTCPEIPTYHCNKKLLLHLIPIV